jgi:hypothetical protein
MGDEEAWKQRRLTGEPIPAPGTMQMQVDPCEGYDDFLMGTAVSQKRWRASPCHQNAVGEAEGDG